MKFALVDNKKVEASKGAKGICPVCSTVVIAKCGEIKINHWSHKQIRDCDRWWENETDWHRSWKNLFPSEWQEIIMPDERTGEKHIADIRTSHGLVVEFQHSKIEALERTSREAFYKNMVWVIDGTRLKRDYPRFVTGKKYFRSSSKQDFYLIDYPDTCFPSVWLQSSVPVIFDFRGTEALDDPSETRNYLYCLFPKRQGSREVTLARITRESFVSNITSGAWFKTQPQNFKQAVTAKLVIRRREPTYDYNPRTGRFVKRRRL